MLNIHSGLQFGGEPIIPDWQVQSHRSPFLLGGLAYGPQGSGLQGSSSTTGAMAEICKNARNKNVCVLLFDICCKDILHANAYQIQDAIHYEDLRSGLLLHAVKGSPK